MKQQALLGFEGGSAFLDLEDLEDPWNAGIKVRLHALSEHVDAPVHRDAALQALLRHGPPFRRLTMARKMLACEGVRRPWRPWRFSSRSKRSKGVFR